MIDSNIISIVDNLKCMKGGLCMKEKNNEVNKYIDNISRYLNWKYPNILSDDKISRAKEMFNNSDEDIDLIKSKIDILMTQTIEEYVTIKEKQKVFIDITKKRAGNIKDNYGIEFDGSKIDYFISKILEQNLTKEQIDKRFEIIDENIKNERRTKFLEKQVRNGTANSNFSNIKKTIGMLFEDEFLSTKLSVYGGTIPYLMTNEDPKRIIENVNTYANFEDMDKIREYIIEHQDKYHVISDSLQLCSEDYGIELSVNGINVSIFPTIATKDGMIVRNFSIQRSTDQITTKSTLFGGIDEQSLIVNYNSDGQNIRLMSPEFTYITKKVANREKDIVDNEVLSNVIDKEKLKQIDSIMKKPEVIEMKIREINVDREISSGFKF